MENTAMIQGRLNSCGKLQNGGLKIVDGSRKILKIAQNIWNLTHAGIYAVLIEADEPNHMNGSMEIFKQNFFEFRGAHL